MACKTSAQCCNQVNKNNDNLTLKLFWSAFFPSFKFVAEIDFCLLHKMAYNKRSQWRLGTSSGFPSRKPLVGICFQLLMNVFSPFLQPIVLKYVTWGTV